MQLGASVRREVIEDLLDIQIFSRMNNILKDRLKDARDTLKDCDHQVAMAERNVQSQQKTISNMELLSEKHKDKMKKRIGEIDARMEENHDEVDELTKKISRMEDIQKEYDEMRDMRVKIQGNLDKADRDLKFYWENDECPTCNQVVDRQNCYDRGSTG